MAASSAPLEGVLGGPVGLAVSRSGPMWGEPQPAQGDPALLRPHAPPEARAHPSGHLRPTPASPIRARPVQGLGEVRLLLLGQQPALPRIAMPPVADAGRPLPIVAMDQFAHPAHRVARQRRDLLAGVPASHQPDDLPLAPLHARAGLAVVALQLVDTQRPLDVQSLVHTSILHPDLVSHVFAPAAGPGLCCDGGLASSILVLLSLACGGMGSFFAASRVGHYVGPRNAFNALSTLTTSPSRLFHQSLDQMR
jgi:hypothetical protein